MSEPRAQRHVAPTHLPRSGAAAQQNGSGAGLRRATTRSSCSLTRSCGAKPRRWPRASRQSSTRRRPTRSTSCASPLGGCASRCGCSAACCRARTPRASAPSCVGSRARSATFAISTCTRENFKAYVQTLPPEQRGGLSAYQLYLRRERAEARQRAAAACASPRAAALFAEPRAVRRCAGRAPPHCAGGAR